MLKNASEKIYLSEKMLRNVFHYKNSTEPGFSDYYIFFYDGSLSCEDVTMFFHPFVVASYTQRNSL